MSARSARNGSWRASSHAGCEVRTVQETLAEDGYVWLRRVFDAAAIGRLTADLTAVLNSEPAAGSLIAGPSERPHGARNLLRLWPAAGKLVRTPNLRAALLDVLGPAAGVVRGLYFDKPPGNGWALPWHRDTTIAVKRHGTPGRFGKPTVKAGVPHVEAPAEMLDGMLAVRVHLDAMSDTNGPLRVTPGSHQLGPDRPAVTLHCQAGDVLLMRPLLLHASAGVRTRARRSPADRAPRMCPVGRVAGRVRVGSVHPRRRLRFFQIGRRTVNEYNPVVRTFGQVREAIVRATGVPRNAVRVDTCLSRLLDSESRPRLRLELVSCGLTPRTYGGEGIVGGWVTGSLFVLLFAAMAWLVSVGSGWVALLLFVAGLAALYGYARTVPTPVPAPRLPSAPVTVGDLTLYLTRLTDHPTCDYRWSNAEIELKTRMLVAEFFGYRLTDVQPHHSFLVDLGAD